MISPLISPVWSREKTGEIFTALLFAAKKVLAADLTKSGDIYHFDFALVVSHGEICIVVTFTVKCIAERTARIISA